MSRQDFVMKNISCKFEISAYNIPKYFLVNASERKSQQQCDRTEF